MNVGGSTTHSSLPFWSGAGINAYSVQIRWQITDRETTTTSSGPPASTPGSPNTASSTSSITTSPTPSPSQSGISTGAAIGIGVSIPIIFFAILFGLFVFWRKRRSKSLPAPAATVADPTNPPWWKPELDAEGKAIKPYEARELQPAAELDVILKRPSELAAPVMG
jgi:hypothetical protein